MKKMMLLCIFLSCCLQGKILLMLEGTTGAGKSTLSKILAQALDARLIIEPVERWRNVHNQGNLLETFINNQSRWGHTFQSYALITNLQAYTEADGELPKKEIHITDRSMYAGFYCFTKMLHDEQRISPLEWYIYKETAEWLFDQFPYKPDGFIYLRTTPEVCLERIKKRNRPEEASCTLKFLQKLFNYHEKWLIKKEDVHPALINIPILIIDGDTEFESNTEIQSQIINSIKEFVEKIKKNKNQN